MSRWCRGLEPGAAVGAALLLWTAVMVSVAATALPSAQARPAVQSPPPGVLIGSSQTPQQQAPPQQTPAPSPAGEYAGEDTCLLCHEDMKKGYYDSAHARVQNMRTPKANQGCESCHGPGKAHADAGGDPTLIKRLGQARPAEVSATCTSCHNRTEHAEWAGSKHDQRSMSCSSCHSIHSAKSPEAQLIQVSERETCNQCHQRESNKIARSSHMPVQEGKMSCSSCHNPHGSQNVRMLREGHSITESCTSCHADKRGPFLWEHAVGRESCVTCHDPHGSNNDRLLVAKQPMLCQRCHVHARHPATIYDQTSVNARSNRIVGRGCVNCHSMVHGSNHPTSGKYFLR
jgi:DmsE family decaheme c-type cytochrome